MQGSTDDSTRNASTQRSYTMHMFAQDFYLRPYHMGMDNVPETVIEILGNRGGVCWPLDSEWINQTAQKIDPFKPMRFTPAAKITVRAVNEDTVKGYFSLVSYMQDDALISSIWNAYCSNLHYFKSRSISSAFLTPTTFTLVHRAVKCNVLINQIQLEFDNHETPSAAIQQKMMRFIDSQRHVRTFFAEAPAGHTDATEVVTCRCIKKDAGEKRPRTSD